MQEIDVSRGRFVRVKCADCEQERNIFDKADSTILCDVCGATVALARGGRADIKGTVVKVHH